MAENIKVVVAEDNAILAELLASHLDQRAGIDVIGTAFDGQQAVDLCALVRPDVVLMDVEMPVMDGLTATRLLRERDPHIQVVILTNGLGSQAEDARSAGAVAYLYKGTSMDQIAGVIRSTQVTGAD